VAGFPQINGVHSDFAVPARYDGNGTTVPAWFRVADATWSIEGHDPIQFGAPSVASPPQFDIPVPGDYNGDGIDELAVYHPSDSTFHVQGVADPIPLGNVGDQPAPADYDGDGRTDPATFAVGTSGVWHIAGRPDVIYPVTTSPNDELFPAPANYDGQGGAEPAVARFTVGPDTIWQISTLGDFDLAGSRIPGPTSFNDTISTLMLAGVQHYCATHTC
jgi:hypothetical protein